MIIDAKNKIVGRIATIAAKQALLGETVHIMNCDHAVITGRKNEVLAKYQHRRNLGHQRGPFLSRSTDRFVRRIVRGMLPYKQPKGATALKKVRCYTGFPEQFKDQTPVNLPKADVAKLPTFRFVTVKELCKKLGGKP